MTKLYYIENEGCDATTYGLVRISDEDFPKFRSFVENLNRNSHYGCMPVISVSEIDEKFIHPYIKPEDNEAWYIDEDILWLDGIAYTIDSDWRWDVDRKLVIKGRT